MDEGLLGGYRYCRELSDLLDLLMRGLADRVALLDASLQLHQVGTLLFDHSGRNVRSIWLNEAERVVTAADGNVMPATSVDDAVQAAEARPALSVDVEEHQSNALRLPIAYGETAIGEFRLRWRRNPERADVQLCKEFARHCGYLAKRYEVQRWTEQRLGRPLLLVGASAPLRELESFVERAARSGLPVLLSGEFGTEKALLAASIHSCGSRRDAPFVEINCADPAGEPAQWFERARGGTLFLSGVDELPLPLQGQIPQHMHSHLGQWLQPGVDVRIVASSAAELGERVREGRFFKSLFVELDFLGITLPPLRQRSEDIAHLAAAVLDRHGHTRRPSEALLTACRAYDWPENLFELERVVARLAVMAEGPVIRHADIVRHAPWIVGQGTLPLDTEPGDTEADQAEDGEATRAVNAAGPALWVRCAFARDAAALRRLHDGLRKALLYLGEHYAEPVSLGQLALHAHVSPSHLTFLFRSEIGTTFKTFLLQMRIQKAQELLRSDTRMRITEVALRVGFADLSHFEKSFRRIVGCSARDFRRGDGGMLYQSVTSK